MSSKASAVLALEEFLTSEVAWSRGYAHPWESQALMSASFLAALYRLACAAPAANILKFIEENSNEL